MDSSLAKKVERLNELYKKKESTNRLSEEELTEQSVLRDEIINYFQFAIRSSANSKKEATKENQ
ncbi:MAG: DUF896 domain-containing protein [Lachnospiraceae bacterium]|nr:DUF896 domain-containing protein [Lachnospiraceae bacterium]